MGSPRRLLYILPGPVHPNKDYKLDKFFSLSEAFQGDVLNPVWWNHADKVNEFYGEESFPTRKVGNFTYHFLLIDKYPSFLHFFIRIFFYVSKGLELSKKQGKYDYIMSYGTNSTGIGALILKLITGSKFISEIPGVPEDGSLFDEPEISKIALIKHKIYDLFLSVVVSGSDHVKLLYETQISHYPSLSRKPSSVFHDFVPTETIESLPSTTENYILFLGAPWYRKGVDLLITAFKSLAKPHPDLTLKIVGWFPDKTFLETLIADAKNIELLPSVSHFQALELISKCKILVLPSRSEAMGRVLLEAMAAKKPIVAANVNGIPTYLIDNLNGLLFEKNNAQDLAAKLSKILEDESYAKLLGEEGYKFLKQELTGQQYVAKFVKMADKIDNNSFSKNS